MESLVQSINMDSFNYLGNIIATGKESKVYLATSSSKTNTTKLAFKGYREDVLNNPQKQKKLLLQINSLWKLSKKENILQIVTEHHRDRMVLIITEYCEGGNLAVFLKKNGAIAEQQAVAYIKQIINGYKSIREAGFIHRNLEPSNIFISGLQIKIGDYSDVIFQSDASFVSRKEEIVGSLLYQAPQILSKYSYSLKSDIYAIGLIFLTMLIGKSPFNGQTKAQILKQMKNLCLQNQLKVTLNQKSKLFLEQTLQFDIKSRMDYESLIDFQFQIFPVIPLTKFFTFDVSSPKFSQGQSKPQFSFPKEPQRSNNQKQIQNKSSKSISNKSRTYINIKVSDEFDVNLYNKSVSIMLPPPKLDMNFENGNTKREQQFQRVNPQLNISLEQQLSLVYMNDKTPSSDSNIQGKSQNVKNIKESLKASSKNKFKIFEPKHQENEKISIKKDIQLQDLKLYQISNKNLTERKNQPERARFTGRTLDTERKRMEQTNGLISSPLTDNINKQMKVVVHSPLRKNSKSMMFQGEMTKEDNIANWMVSQINMARYLSRVIYRIQKLRNKQDDQLCGELNTLKQKILKQTKQLKHLDHSYKELFSGSSQHTKLVQIIDIMSEKTGKLICQISQEKIEIALYDRILVLYNEVKEDQRVKSEKIIALDFMISCWLLIKLLKKRNLEYFYSKSKLDLIMQNQMEKITVSTVLNLYDRMKALGMIPK